VEKKEQRDEGHHNLLRADNERRGRQHGDPLCHAIQIPIFGRPYPHFDVFGQRQHRFSREGDERLVYPETGKTVGGSIARQLSNFKESRKLSGGQIFPQFALRKISAVFLLDIRWRAILSSSDKVSLIAIATQCFAPDVGGIEILMTGLADELAASGVEVEVFADRIRLASGRRFLRPYAVERFGFVRPVRRFLKYRAIARLMKERRVSGIFADSWKSVEAVPQTDAPIAVLAHGTELPLNASPGKSRRIKSAYSRAHSIIASSNYTADLAAKFVEGDSSKILIVNPPIAPPPSVHAPALAEIDASIAGRGPVIVTLARLEPRKGVDTVIRAMPVLRQTHPGLVYLVGGAGRDLARLQYLALELGIADAVIFLGSIDDPQRKAALLSRADIYAMPSRRTGNSVEGFGISYVEAAWYGVPVVAGDDGGAGDAVIPGETGLLCNGSDDGDVCAAIARLLDDHQLRRRLGSAGALRARSQIWSAMLPRYLAAIGQQVGAV
jgi:phosphatidylinositol alpha-1,6-mannosyltransferase